MKESDILLEPSVEALQNAVQENWMSLIRISGSTEYGFISEEEEYTYFGFQSDGVPAHGFCGLIRTSPDRCGAVVDEVLDQFKGMGLSGAFYLTPVSKPMDEIDRQLRARGLTKSEGFAVMWADLHKLVQERPNPEGLTIERIVDDAGMDTYRDIYHEGHEPNRAFIDYMTGGMKIYGYEPDAPIRNYLGYLDGEAVGTSQLNLNGGVVCINSVVVRPEFRRRGLGTAITLETLRLAIPFCFKYAVLWATEMGIGIYRRMGFQVLFVPLTYFRSRDH
jgi:GNAT superfamily N-acetyltransferase